MRNSPLAGLAAAGGILATARYWHSYMNVMVWTTVVFGLIAATFFVVYRDRLSEAINRLVGRRGEKKVRSILAKAKVDAVHDVFLEGDQGEVAQVDHIALVGNSLLVIETKNWFGRIYASEGDSEWTRVYDDGGKLVVGNPVEQNRRQVRILKSSVGGNLDILGIVVFMDHVEFAKGTPKEVVLASQLELLLARISGRETPLSGKPAWDSLKIRLHDRTEQAALAQRHRLARDERAILKAIPGPFVPKAPENPSLTHSRKRSGV